MEIPESDIPAGKLFDATLLGRVMKYVRPYARPMLIAVLIVLPMTVLANFMPILIRNAIDKFLTPADLTPAARIRGLAEICWKFLALGAGAFFLRFAQNYLMTWIGQKILFDLRADIFSKVMRLPLRYFDKNPVGRLLTRVSSDVDALQRLLTDGLVGLTTSTLR